MKKLATLSLALAATLASSQAAIVWTGAVDADLTNDGNWDFTNADNGVATIAGINDSTLNSSISFSNVGTNPIIGEQAAQPSWGVSAGNSIEIDGVSLDTAGNDGIQGDVISILNGGNLNIFYARQVINVDATSSINLLGGGDPLPGVAALNLTPGAVLTMASVGEFTEQGGQIFVNGTSFASDPTILDFSGAPGANSALAVPEPSSSVLVGLAGLALLARRRH